MNIGSLQLIEAEIATVVGDVATRRWVKEALSTALARDPIDAAADADMVADLLNRRCDAMLEDSDQLEMFGT